MPTIASPLQSVKQRIDRACAEAGREAGCVHLLAVSKTQPAGVVQGLAGEGQRAFGESYVQEALAKIERLRGLELEWHFIGPLQSNKTRAIAEQFAWVHSVDRLRIAERLSSARPGMMPPLQVCLQVNISAEPGKQGVSPEALPSLAEAVASLPQLQLRGLMTIPEPTEDTRLQRARFRQLRLLRDELNARGLRLDTLSMGMSGDLEAAIVEGATLVRVGSALFGARPEKRG